ncbi:MAG: hypothetical protein ABIS51_15235, partial [Sphingomonas sp.]
LPQLIRQFLKRNHPCAVARNIAHERIPIPVTCIAGKLAFDWTGVNETLADTADMVLSPRKVG